MSNGYRLKNTECRLEPGTGQRKFRVPGSTIFQFLPTLVPDPILYSKIARFELIRENVKFSQAFHRYERVSQWL